MQDVCFMSYSICILANLKGKSFGHMKQSWLDDTAALNENPQCKCY